MPAASGAVAPFGQLGKQGRIWYPCGKRLAPLETGASRHVAIFLTQYKGFTSSCEWHRNWTYPSMLYTSRLNTDSDSWPPNARCSFGSTRTFNIFPVKRLCPSLLHRKHAPDLAEHSAHHLKTLNTKFIFQQAIIACDVCLRAIIQFSIATGQSLHSRASSGPCVF